MPRMRYILPVVVIIALIGLLGYGLTQNPRNLPSTMIGRQAPAFSLPRLEQPQGLLSASQMRGHVSVLNVWASWCVSCRAEHRLIENLAKRTGVAVYGLNYKDDRADAIRWLRQYGNPFTAIAVDTTGQTGIDYGVAAVPETFFMDARGVVRYKQIGPVDRDELEHKIIPLVRKLQAEANS